MSVCSSTRATAVLSACGSKLFSMNVAFLVDLLFLFSWCQHVDTLLMDMRLPHMRSGGNWFTWPFQVIEQKEIATLGEERRVRRFAISSSS